MSTKGTDLDKVERYIDGNFDRFVEELRTLMRQRSSSNEDACESTFTCSGGGQGCGGSHPYSGEPEPPDGGGDQPGDFICGQGRAGHFECKGEFTCRADDDFDCDSETGDFDCNVRFSCSAKDDFFCENDFDCKEEFHCYDDYACPSTVDCKSSYECPEVNHSCIVKYEMPVL